MAGGRRKQLPATQDPPQLSAPPPRRSKRATAGQGGYTDQLERVAAVIETPARQPSCGRDANLPDDEPVNLMAPAPRHPRRGAHHRSGKGSENKLIYVLEDLSGSALSLSPHVADHEAGL
ncbi:hypothetical protein L210DRAFT_990070 [Boletus edulis BED1]|uniref:Uncharacterized protein n=1 Tax=Boletus edulis BED1 TaxID=1328754 RepID=A0AAD4BD50_BOLED|nr:hypothetical protein L210DRAFT_990070 [Boletus edulis BED1]